MSAGLRRGGGCVAYTLAGAIHDAESFVACMAAHRFRTIEHAASEETSIGWVTPSDPTGGSHRLEDMDGGNLTWMRARIDVKKFPAATLAMHVAAAEHARGKRLSAREKRELKRDLHERLLPRILPSTTFVDVLLHEDSRRVLVLTTSKIVQDPKTYREMSVPFDDAASANKAVQDFFVDLKEIRKKHRMRDLLVTAQVPYVAVSHDGKSIETVGLVNLTIGSSAEALHMAAIAYGSLRADHQAGLDVAVDTGASVREGDKAVENGT